MPCHFSIFSVTWKNSKSTEWYPGILHLNRKTRMYVDLDAVSIWNDNLVKYQFLK